jgi:hypothetical protein
MQNKNKKKVTSKKKNIRTETTKKQSQNRKSA